MHPGAPIPRAAVLAIALASSAALACSGSIDRPATSDDPTDDPGASRTGGRSGRPPDTSKPDPVNPVAPASVTAAAAPLRRLTRDQYLNTLHDLLGAAADGVVAPRTLPGDDTIDDRFPNNAASPVAPIDVGKYGDAALAVAAKATGMLATVVPCSAQGMNEACATHFIQSFGRRAYRRPLTPDEIALMQTVYAAGGDFPTGIRLVITAVLQSPKFLYVPELVPADAVGKVVAVDAWAMASRLSYFLLNTMPDEPLFTAAEMGKLATAQEVAAQAKRLMAGPRFAATLASFHEYWLQLGTLSATEKDATLYPRWSAEVRGALLDETRRFVQHVFTEGDQRLETLLSAPFSFLSAPLYTHYGLPAATGAAGFQKVTLPADQRAGLLTQAGLLATLAHENRTSFILRGKMVREALFCDVPRTPPNDVPAEPPFDPNASAKVRADQHSTNPACAVCHKLFDPIGFAFEIYDAAGQFRTKDAAGPIDANVELSDTEHLDGKTAKNAVELMRLLASDEQVRGCFATQWMRFALGRDLTADAADKGPDAPSLATARKAFGDGGGKLPDLLLAIAQSNAFRYQLVPQ